MAIVMMPALSPTMTEGKLSTWLVAEGDAVTSGDVIAEIETDKAVMEVEALDDGVVTSLVVAAGTAGIAVGAAIAEILAEGEESALSEALSQDASSKGNDNGQGSDQKNETTPEMTKAEMKPSSPAPAKNIQQKTSKPPHASSQVNKGSRIFASPLARRLAAQNNIDLEQLSTKGSGPHGRIVKADIEAAIESGIGKMTASPTAAAQKQEAFSLVENSPMRQVIAQRLQQSKQEAPHFYLNMDIDLGAILAARKGLNAHAPEGVKVSVNDMLIKAAAVTLMRVPSANASWEDSHTKLWHHADISVAVAIEGGLITPIIEMAETKGLYAISTEMRELAGKARAGKLMPHEYTGGSFTISNLGMYGITSFSAVINPPQGAILAIGAGEERPVVRDGNITIATMLTATLSCDHRVVDGAVGAEWLKAFKEIVENPYLILG